MDIAEIILVIKSKKVCFFPHLNNNGKNKHN